MKMYSIFLLLICCSGYLYSQTTCDFSGTWTTVWDGVECEMQITCYGSSATGTYSYYNGSTTIYGNLKGTISKDFSDGLDAKWSFKGSWTEPGLSGTFEFGRLCSKNVFGGYWWNSNGLESGTWNGILK